jgi:hypothetical protein
VAAFIASQGAAHGICAAAAYRALAQCSAPPRSFLLWPGGASRGLHLDRTCAPALSWTNRTGTETRSAQPKCPRFERNPELNVSFGPSGVAVTRLHVAGGRRAGGDKVNPVLRLGHPALILCPLGFPLEPGQHVAPVIAAPQEDRVDAGNLRLGRPASTGSDIGRLHGQAARARSLKTYGGGAEYNPRRMGSAPATLVPRTLGR